MGKVQESRMPKWCEDVTRARLRRMRIDVKQFAAINELSVIEIESGLNSKSIQVKFIDV